MRALLWAGIVTGAVLLVLLGRTVWHVWGTEREARQAHLSEQDALNDLTERKTALSGEIKSLDTPRGMEAEVRERFPVAKSGEEVIVLTDSPTEATATRQEATSSLWSTVLSWFSWL
jgi:hypothetical protein